MIPLIGAPWFQFRRLKRAFDSMIHFSGTTPTRLHATAIFCVEDDDFLLTIQTTSLQVDVPSIQVQDDQILQPLDT